MKAHWTRFAGTSELGAARDGELQHISVALVRANRYQPRVVFDEAKLEELSATIRAHGVIQPIVVRRQDGYFELVAGERRWRAAQKIGLDFIPAIVRELSDSQAASLALIENLQREGLTAIEEAVAYQQLIELHRLTQESLAQRLGKGQSTIANKLRLLHLCAEAQEAIRQRTITERHGRALLGLAPPLQQRLVQEIIGKELNVRQTEKRANELTAPSASKAGARRVSLSRDVRLAINTVRQSVKLIEKTGYSVQLLERDEDEFYELVIRVPKFKDV
ncbi:MAG: nucleoid occlusion protein [Bacilli bacterium]